MTTIKAVLAQLILLAILAMFGITLFIAVAFIGFGVIMYTAWQILREIVKEEK